MSLKQTIAARIRHHRLSRDLTQEALAEKVDRSVDAISSLERGKMLPSLDTLERIGAALDVPVSAFFEQSSGTMSEREALIARVLAYASQLDDRQLAVAAEQLQALAKKRA